MRDPEEERFVGHAQVPLPVTAIPYTDPYPEPMPPQKPRRGLLAAGLAVTILLVCTFGVLIGLSLGGDRPLLGPSQPSRPAPSPTPPPPAPKVVAERFLTATIAGNEAVVQQNLCKLLRNNDGQTPGNQREWLVRFVGFKIGDETINGPSASVGVELTVPILGPIPFELHLVKEDGAWRVCGLGPA